MSQTDFADLAEVFDRERERHGIPAALAAEDAEPADPTQLAVWRALPKNGSGLDYERVTNLHGIRQKDAIFALLQLVLARRAYVAPAPKGSVAGRGLDPRALGFSFGGNIADSMRGAR